MEYFRLIDQLRIHFVEPEAGVRAGLSRETEGAVPALVEGHERQCREHVRIHHDPGGRDPGIFQGLQQHFPERVITHFSKERTLVSEVVQGSEEIRRSSSCMCRHRRIPVSINAFFRKINQQFSQCRNFNHSVNPPAYGSGNS